MRADLSERRRSDWGQKVERRAKCRIILSSFLLNGSYYIWPPQSHTHTQSFHGSKWHSSIKDHFRAKRETSQFPKQTVDLRRGGFEERQTRRRGASFVLMAASRGKGVTAKVTFKVTHFTKEKRIIGGCSPSCQEFSSFCRCRQTYTHWESHDSLPGGCWRSLRRTGMGCRPNAEERQHSSQGLFKSPKSPSHSERHGGRDHSAHYAACFCDWVGVGSLNRCVGLSLKKGGCFSFQKDPCSPKPSLTDAMGGKEDNWLWWSMFWSKLCNPPVSILFFGMTLWPWSKCLQNPTDEKTKGD